MPARRRDPISVPRTFHSPSLSGHHVRHDYGIDESISRAGYFSNAVLEDTEAAAARSRGKDYDLLRNTHSAIRYDSPRASRPNTRLQSLPPVIRSTPSPSPTPRPVSSVLPPRRSWSRASSVLDTTPSPHSLLSSKISMFLRGSSLPPGGRPSSASLVSYKSYLDSASPLPPSRRDESLSVVGYKSHLSDPTVTSPFTTRSSSRSYHGFVPSPSLSRLRSTTDSGLPRYNISLGDGYDSAGDYDDDDNDDEDDYEPLSYRRKYKVLRGSKALPSRPSSTLYYSAGSPEGSDDEDASYGEGYSGTYSSCPRPSGASYLRLSSYEAPHDGSYEADMAEMYDYVPFGPSRQGILELTQRRDDDGARFESIDDVNDDDEDDDGMVSRLYLPPQPSSTLLTSSIKPSLTSSIPPTLHFKPSSDLITSPVSSFANSSLFDSILSSTAARARAALADSLPLSSYRNASLLLSVEGSAVSEDGKDRYGFKYYPPPVPIKGSSTGIDERLLGVTPSLSSPADSLFNDYLGRLKNLRTEIRDLEDRADSSHSRSVAVPRPLPSYSHSTVHMPVHIAGRAQSIPVSSYRTQANDRGLSHRVDVFPLVESSALLGKDKLQIPFMRAGGDTGKLTLLDKINIKAAIIGSKMEAEDDGKKRKLRPAYHVDKSRETSVGSTQSSIFYDPGQSSGLYATRQPLPKPSERKPIRTVDGFTKPKNVMSWEYRVESRLSPDDLLYTPSSFGRMRDQVRGAQEKIDRHRQLLDRYLDSDTKPASSYSSSNSVNSPKSSAGGDPNNAPMSDLRRRLRRTLAKTKSH